MNYIKYKGGTIIRDSYITGIICMQYSDVFGTGHKMKYSGYSNTEALRKYKKYLTETYLK